MRIEKLRVRHGGLDIGDLVYSRSKRRLFFKYAPEWLASGFSISPVELPLRDGWFEAPDEPFGGNFGVFDDSLPDGWGRRIFYEYLRAKGIEYGSLTVVEKLALIGSSGRGSLEYFPQCGIDGGLPEGEPAILAEEVRALLQGRFNGDFGKWARLSGASGGARPKVHICHEGREWIVKFGDSPDPEAMGKMEYQYALTAAKAGLQMPETELFEGRYFGVRRFDRDGDGNRLLMLSAAGLLCGEQGFMLLDYKDLLAATLDLTGDLSEVEKMFRLMCFNVLAKNCDDHARNFAFLRGGDGRWRVAPGFDLTYAPCLFGRQATTVAGKYAEIGLPEVLEAASGLNLDPAAARLVWEQVKTAVEEDRLVYLARDTLASREAPGSEA